MLNFQSHNLIRKELILPIITLLISCSTKHSYFDNYRFDRNAILEVTIKGVGVPVDFELYARQGFPLQVHKKQLSICQDTVFTIPVPSSIYELTYIKIGDESFMNIYTIPGDTLKISLDLDIELAREDRISFDGYTSGICLYFEEKRKNWIETKGYDYYYDSTISLQSFTDKMDRNRENDLEFLAEYKSQNRLPGWFIETEKNNIIYETAGSKMSIINYHQHFYDSQFQPPEGYYAFADEMKINNPEALLSSAYYGFLTAYYGRSSKVVEFGFPTLIQWCEETLDLLESGDFDLDPRIEDVLLGRRIFLLFSDKYLTQKNVQRSDSILEISEEYFNGRDIFLIIKKYRDAQYEKFANQPVLSPGDNAPGFYLSDLSGKYVRLSDFRGKVVYINFWATYCSPCIASIPDKNLLVKEFQDESFEVVNICLDHKPDLWASIIDEHDFAGIHLICKGNWNQLLRDRYIIHTVPHYALVDSEGRLISNNCEKPIDVSHTLRTIFE